MQSLKVGIFFIHIFGCSLAANNNDTKTAKVLILGAGMSGISAAKRLKQKGIDDFLVLEGSHRVGGRVMEAPLGDYDVELGTMWIAGGKKNPLYKLTKKYNVKTAKCNWGDYVIRKRNGRRMRSSKINDIARDLNRALELIEEKTKDLLTNDKPDRSQQSVLREAGWYPRTSAEHLLQLMHIDYDFAAPPEEISTKYSGEAAYDIYGEDDFITTSKKGGYSKIIRGMADEIFPIYGRLQLNTVVTEIHQNDSHVTVMTKDGQTYVAESVIVTFSLGVLQHKLIKFEPELPKWKWDSIFDFQFNVYLHFYMLFPSTFWDAEEYLMYASKNKGRYSIWINFNKFWPNSHILKCTVIHDEAERLLAMTDDEIKTEAMVVLRNMYGSTIPDAIGFVMPRFTTDPMFMGMFSNWPPGYTADSHKSLQAAVGRVHFAGEHTSFLHYGCLQGSYLSGRDVANEVVRCLKDSCKQYVPPYGNINTTSNYDGYFDSTTKYDNITETTLKVDNSIKTTEKVDSHIQDTKKDDSSIQTTKMDDSNIQITKKDDSNSQTTKKDDNYIVTNQKDGSYVVTNQKDSSYIVTNQKDGSYFVFKRKEDGGYVVINHKDDSFIKNTQKEPGHIKTNLNGWLQ